jgi:hypothetical protein
LLSAAYGECRPLEIVAVPTEEAYRLCWLGIAEPVGFDADAVRGEAEHRLRFMLRDE